MSGADWVERCKSIPLPAVAAALGLPARGDRVTCPACGTEAKSRRCWWWPRTSPVKWTCAACGGGGSAVDLAAWRILGRPPGSTDWPRVREWFASHGWCDGAPGAGPGPRLRPLPAPPRVDAARGPVLDLAAAWEALAPLHDAAAAAAWWVRRGVDEASALELASVPDLIHLPDGRPPRDLPPQGARLWGLCAATRSAPRRPLLYLVRDGHGAPRGAQRRVVDAEAYAVAVGEAKAAGVAAPGKAAALPAEALPVAFEGRPHLLGCVRAAAAALAAGSDLVLVEGEVDHALAVAAGWVALGATGASGLRHAAAALVDALQSLEIDAIGLGCVHLVAHVGDTATPSHPGGAGAECMAAAGEVLRAAGVPTAVVDLPRRPDGRGDLGDVAEGRSGPRAVVGTLPALEAVRAVLASGVRVRGHALALNVDDARRRVLPGLLAEAKHLAGPDKLVVVGVPMGIGKTHAAAVWSAADLARDRIAAAAELASEGLAVVYATPTHALAREVVEHAKRGGVAPGVVVHAKGLTAEDDNGAPLCKALAAAVGRGEGDLFRRALATEGRSVCKLCDWVAGCPVTGRTKPRPGEVVVMPVHMLPHLPPGSTHFVVLDDCGKDEAEAKATRPALEAMRPGTLPGARLGTLAALVDVLTQALDLAHLAHLAHVEAVEAAAALARAGGGRAAPPHTADDVGYRLTGEALAAALAPLRAAAVDWAAAAESPDPWAIWPAPVVEAIGGGAFVRLKSVPDRSALEALCLAVAMVLEQPARAHLAVCLDRAGWALEIRRPPTLPDGAAVVALDGSAARAPLQWGSVARRTGRTLVDLSMTVLSAPSVPYHWRQGKGLNISRVGARGDGVFTFSDDAPGALQTALAAALEAIALRRRRRPLPLLGIVTHLPLEVAMRKALGEALGGDELARVRWDEAAAAVGEVARDLAKHCAGLVVGHYGADDRGTNRFNAVGVLAVLGCPRPPLAALEATADAMGVDDPRALVDERVAETLAQAVARARHLSNRNLDAIVGCADAPAPAGPDLPGLVPTTAEASTGDHHAWPRAVRLAGLRALADERGELLPADGDPREIEAVARALEWTCYPVGAPGGGPRRLAWAPMGWAGEGSKDCRSNDSGYLASFWAQSGRVEPHDFPGEVGAPAAHDVGGGTAAPLFSIRTEAKNPVSTRNHSTEDVPAPPVAAAAAPPATPPGRSTMARLPFEDDDDEWPPPVAAPTPAAAPLPTPHAWCANDDTSILGANQSELFEVEPVRLHSVGRRIARPRGRKN